MKKLLKAQYFINRMNEYEMKCFSKTLVLNLDLPKKKKKIQSIFLKFSNFKHILHYNQGIFNLGWPKQDHTQ